MAAHTPFGAALDPADESAVARSEQQFGLHLLQQAGAGAGGNVTVSPLSLAVALAMLESGAGGRTLAEIAATLHTPSLSATGQDDGWASLIGTLNRESAADGISLQSANSLWLQDDLVMDQPFMTIMARYFSAGVWQADFAHDLAGTGQAINEWVSHHTSGRITQLFAPGQLKPTTLLVLANAVYFHADWQTPFDPGSSFRGAFHPAPGQESQVTFMAGPTTRATITPGYQAVQLPYTGGHFEALVVMPEGQTLENFVSNLTVERLDGILAGVQQAAQVQLPRFTTQSFVDLNQALAAMGMPTAFTRGADFSGMSPTGLEVQSVVQRDYLSVGEKGTEAAAATGVSIGPTAIEVPPRLVTFDHPFLFAIRDTAAGALVFTSLVESPSS